MKKSFCLFSFILFLLASCGENLTTEAAFLQDYTQKIAAQLENSSTVDFQQTVFKTKQGHWQRNYKLADLGDEWLKYLEYAQDCAKSLKQRQSVATIRQKFEQAFFYWQKIPEKLYPHYLHREKEENYQSMFGHINDKIANFYQMLSYLDREAGENTWLLLEMSAGLVFNEMNNFLFSTAGHSGCNCYNFNNIYIQIYTDKPLKINQEAELKFIITTSNDFLYEMGVNADTLRKNMRYYEFTPSQAGVQDLDIRAQVHKKNGDTVFLTKKIQMEVLE